ncbi:type IV secretory system conjugative DNA transfer family protein [Williamsia sp.]|uniref:type IV secretory system conjugative DNA transfer family protein n=1 Tax=Williamsia sp. TaxID=1872085 RepID=UPI0025F1315C|nr:type IV secretory system conjugative DNA transfer family protein [Williamsia sp.]
MVHGRGERLYASWEDTQLDIWGPRTGKSTSRIIPAIMDAPGAVIATSNKRDLVDATRDPRAQLGSKPWVFDPQDMVGEVPTWWWNPLSYVVDDVSAIKLADLFAAGSSDPGAKTDAFFDPEGKDVLAATLLAAALDGRPVTQVYSWVTTPSMEAAVVLRRNGYDLMGDALAAHISSPEKQKAGVFGTAKKTAGCLRLRGFQPWVTQTGGHRPHLDVEQFVRNGDTLHLLSKEGAGTGGPLVAGLTVAIIEEAERQGSLSRGGRLATPLLAALDEAANIVRWPQLPNLYSHYGSRGIMLMTMLQSWSQGVECWGEAGMKKLWSAANVKVYGGGVSELEFLRSMSELVGDYDYIGSSTSSGSGNGSSGSVSRQAASGRILTAAHLNEWPRGRALVFSSGNRATVIKPEPWMAGPHARAIETSIKANDPTADTTLGDLRHGLTAVPLQSAVDTTKTRAS